MWREYHCGTSRESIERRRVRQVRFLNLGLALDVASSRIPLPLPNPRQFSQAPPSSIVNPPTAPRPISRMLHQPLHHWIRVHVMEFFILFPPAIHVETVKPRLPERSQRFPLLRKRQSYLPRVRCPSTPPPHAQLQLLQHRGRRPLHGFAH